MMREAERFFILQQIDTLWREHLQAMDAFVSPWVCVVKPEGPAD